MGVGLYGPMTAELIGILARSLHPVCGSGQKAGGGVVLRLS
jgi:hypothetical protein